MSPDDPRHGTNAGHHAGCRAACCREARNRYERNRRKARETGRPAVTSPIGTQRRIRALMALGWSGKTIAKRTGLASQQTIHEVMQERRYVLLSTAASIAALYDELSMTLGPSAITRARAQRNGWPPPLAWDDIDDPEEQPKGLDRNHADDVDEAVVTRVLNGEHLPTTPAERREITARWPGSLAELERRFGWNANRYKRSA